MKIMKDTKITAQSELSKKQPALPCKIHSLNWTGKWVFNMYLSCLTFYYDWNLISLKNPPYCRNPWMILAEGKSRQLQESEAFHLCKIIIIQASKTHKSLARFSLLITKFLSLFFIIQFEDVPGEISGIKTWAENRGLYKCVCAKQSTTPLQDSQAFKFQTVPSLKIGRFLTKYSQGFIHSSF